MKRRNTFGLSLESEDRSESFLSADHLFTLDHANVLRLRKIEVRIQKDGSVSFKNQLTTL